MSKVRVATCVPRQYWMQSEKLGWLQKALHENPCDLFISSQELFGGGSTREICRLKGIKTDDVPVTEGWLTDNIGGLARKFGTCIGIGASVKRRDVVTEDFLYYSRKGELVGYHSKLALPEQDSVILDGASSITPETDYGRACRVIEIPELGIRVGTVFCWQVFFTDFWAHLMRQCCSLVAHPIKFAPRAWYTKGQTPEGKTRIGFKQNTGSDDPKSDPLGWIRKLKYESEFKQMPIACSCNTWDGGDKYLALVGWVDEVTHRTNLVHLPSTAETEKVVVTEYDPALFDALPTFPHGYEPGYGKEDYKAIEEKKMMRKSIRCEMRAQSGKAAAKLEDYAVKKAVGRAVLGKGQKVVAGLSQFFDEF